MTNNQQLAAHCRAVIANPQDQLYWVVDMARVALASLEAKPVAKFVYEGAGKRWHHIPHGQYQHTEPKLRMVKLYTAPPVMVMQPVVLPPEIQQHETCKHNLEPSDAYGMYWGSKIMRKQCAEAIRAAGGSVKE